MFAKVIIKSKSNSSKSGSKSGATNLAKIECVKLLDSKRSQSIGILMTSQRLDSQIIRDALLGFDNELLRYNIFKYDVNMHHNSYIIFNL